jgi:hypothetical protein
MRTRNNIMVLDTETVGTFGTPLIHDFGFTIIDKDFNVLHKDRKLVKELHEEGKWILKTSDFYNEYAKDYEKARKTEKVLYWKEIVAEVIRCVKEYKVSTFGAYNLQFDYKAIKYTEQLFNREKPSLAKMLDTKSKNLLCIYNLACETILQSPQYHQFAEENGYVSEAGNFQTNAEVCYRYITGETNYKEKHTALSDAEDETEILRYIVRNVKGNKNMQYGLYYNCWKKAQG